VSEKQTLSRLLRSKEVYEADSSQESEPKSSRWRTELLGEFAEGPSTHQQVAMLESNQNTPLEAHHLLLMLPVGLMLFAMGWLFGSQIISMEQIAGVSPWVWVGISVLGSVGFMSWRGLIVKINLFK